jgi:hypothetical protein
LEPLGGSERGAGVGERDPKPKRPSKRDDRLGHVNRANQDQKGRQGEEIDKGVNLTWKGDDARLPIRECRSPVINRRAVEPGVIDLTFDSIGRDKDASTNRSALDDRDDS